MLRHIHWILLRKLPGPFFGWLGTLMFLLLMQFLIRWLPEIAGKGIPLTVIFELIVYNLAYMLVLAVPMSVLLASLMAFGRLSETQAYAVVKSSGISFRQIVWPALVVSIFVALGMVYFNNVILPEANFRARNLWRDIRSKQPGFDLQPGMFYTGLDDYSILVRERPSGTNMLRDVTIYDYTQGSRRQAIIKAKEGELRPAPDGASVTLILEDGSLHRSIPAVYGDTTDRYEHLTFARHELRIDLSEFVFERTSPREGSRSDRTMLTSEMMQVVDSLETELHARRAELRRKMAASLRPDSVWRAPPNEPEEERDAAPVPEASAPDEPGTAPATAADDLATIVDSVTWVTDHAALQGEPLVEQRRILEQALMQARTARTDVKDMYRTIDWQERRINRHKVEIYKKFSIAVACIVFMLIGAPLGLSIRNGSLAIIGAYALGIFMFYWVTLVQGEKLADRGFLPPWLGMWIANAVMLVLAIWLVIYIVLDLRATPPLRRRLLAWFKSDA